ncbi:unnamed protein product [Calypogeia fissa]
MVTKMSITGGQIMCCSLGSDGSESGDRGAKAVSCTLRTFESIGSGSSKSAGGVLRIMTRESPSKAILMHRGIDRRSFGRLPN